MRWYEGPVAEETRYASHVTRRRLMGVELTFTFSFWPERAATKVTFDCTCEGTGLARLWAGKMAKAVERADDQRIERLKAAMERPA